MEMKGDKGEGKWREMEMEGDGGRWRKIEGKWREMEVNGSR